MKEWVIYRTLLHELIKFGASRSVRWKQQFDEQFHHTHTHTVLVYYSDINSGVTRVYLSVEIHVTTCLASAMWNYPTGEFTFVLNC